MNSLQLQYARDSLRAWRKYNIQPVEATQSLKDFELYKRKNVAFEEWRRKLEKGSRLPRGRFFVGKSPGDNFILFVDEFHTWASPVHIEHLREARVPAHVPDDAAPLN